MSTPRRMSHIRFRTAVTLAILTAVASSGFAGVAARASTAPTLQLVNVAGFSGVLANSSGMTLYVLSTERGGAIHCHPTCLKTWLPLEVSNSTTSVSVGAGVYGTIGFVPRTSTRKQVTFNSYPLYRYIKDTAPGQAGGEDLSTYAGTWLLARGAATTASDTPVYPTLQSIVAGKYTAVLANDVGRSLYLLSTEKGAVVHCAGTCLTRWIPLEVHSKSTPVTIGRNVAGSVGLVARSSSLFQVTYNSYPVYRFAGDSGPGQTNGEGRVSFGGTWFLVRASATSAKSTPIPPS